MVEAVRTEWSSSSAGVARGRMVIDNPPGDFIDAIETAIRFGLSLPTTGIVSHGGLPLFIRITDVSIEQVRSFPHGVHHRILTIEFEEAYA